MADMRNNANSRLRDELKKAISDNADPPGPGNPRNLLSKSSKLILIAAVLAVWILVFQTVSVSNPHPAPVLHQTIFYPVPEAEPEFMPVAYIQPGTEISVVGCAHISAKPIESKSEQQAI